MTDWQILAGDVRKRLAELEDGSVRCCVTSPPYWGLRDYGHDGQIGLEQTPDEYVAQMVAVFREVRRVLAHDGTLWLNLGDTFNSQASNQQGKNGTKSGVIRPKSAVDGYAGMGRRKGLPSRDLKPKDLIGIPWRVAFALQADGWWLRQDIIWHKPNPMPESVTDRCTKAHEYVFLLTKSAKYHYDASAIQELAETFGRQGRSDTMQPKQQAVAATGYRNDPNLKDDFSREHRNRRSVWSITTKPFKDAHFAVMPEALAEPCVLAGSAPGDLVLDPFTGSGTVAVVALKHDRRFIGVELNSDYIEIATKRIEEATAQQRLQL